MKSPVKRIREKLDITQRRLNRAILDGHCSDFVVNTLENGNTTLRTSHEATRGPTLGEKKLAYQFLENLASVAGLDFDKLLEAQKKFEEEKIDDIRRQLKETDFEL